MPPRDLALLALRKKEREKREPSKRGREPSEKILLSLGASLMRRVLERSIAARSSPQEVIRRILERELG